MKCRTVRFSLLELLVVIAVLSILFTLLNPALKKALDASNTINCSNNLKQIGFGFSNYTYDFDDYFPLYNSRNWPRVKYYDWYTNMLDNAGAIPKITKWLEPSPWEGSWGRTADNIWRCPSVKDEDIAFSGGYGVNQTNMIRYPARGGAVRLTEVQRTSEIILSADSKFREDEFRTSKQIISPISGNWKFVPGAAPRHSFASNGVFVDMHVNLEEYQSMKNNENDMWAHHSF